MKQSLKEKIIKILKYFPKTREDDTLLVLKIWEEFYYDVVQMDENYVTITREGLKKVPSFVTIRRTRQIIQNDMGLYPPPPNTKNKRRKREIQMRNNIRKEKKINISKKTSEDKKENVSPKEIKQSDFLSQL